MNLQDILSRYASGNADPDLAAQSEQHFDTAARSVPPDVLGQGVADALRSDQTPPFGDMLGQMFGQSDPQQKASVLNQLLQTLGPGALAGLGGGLLGRVLGSPAAASPIPRAPSITPEQASRLSPADVSEIAAHAEHVKPL